MTVRVTSFTLQNFEDAKKREIKKIEKKLKQIEHLEEKHDEGYSYNTDEVIIHIVRVDVMAGWYFQIYTVV